MALYPFFSLRFNLALMMKAQSQRVAPTCVCRATALLLYYASEQRVFFMSRTARGVDFPWGEKK
jgi:hypothetical protein